MMSLSQEIAREVVINKDSTIQHVIQDAFNRSSYWPMRHVDCEFDNGKITLRGNVPSYFMKQLATELAKDSDAVSIRNLLKVVYKQR